MDVSIQAEVQTFTHPKFGTCVAAAANFAKGQVVLKEKPLLLVPADTYVPSTLSDLAARNDLGKISRDVFRPALVLASTPPDVRSSVLKELFIPDIDQDPSLQETTAYKCSKDVAGVVAEGHDIHAEELMRGLLAFEANAHGFRGGQAVFKFGSKLAHTCNQPNTKYKSSDDGYGCHIAVRDIKNGDLLTTSYIDEEHLLCSTSARQDFIRDKFMFTCCCGSCASADFFRGLPCPLCLPSGGRDAKAMSRLATDFALGQRPLPGTLFFDPSKVHTGKPWTCNSCSSALEDDPSRLGLPTKFKDYVLAEHGQRGLTIGEKTSFDPSHLERSLERQVLRLEEFLDERPVAVPEVFWGLLADCCGYLGPAHWTTHRMNLINAEWRAGELVGIFCMLPPMVYAMMGPRVMSDAKDHLYNLEKHVDNVLRWVEGLPPPPMRRSTPDLVGNTLKNITTQLARCALCEDPPPRFESLQRRMAALVDRYVAVVKLSLNYSHETWEDSGSSDEVFKLMATPRFQALSGQSRAAGECSALDTFHAMQSFLPSPQPSTGFGKRKQGKKGKGHKKKGH